MNGYGTRDVGQILGLSENRVRAYVQAGFLSPARGSRGRLQFSFEDLVFLRTARGLLESRIAPRRVRRALATLRKQLPEGGRWTGLHITAEGSRIVVTDGATRWQPESGQILFDFGVAELARKVAPIARRAFAAVEKQGEALSAEAWYAWGCELEAAAPAEARQAYSRALALDPGLGDAHVNLGRLLHEAGNATAAETHYRRALEADPEDATAAFNLGVALEDLGRARSALEAYEKAAAIDPENADAHYNATNLAIELGEAALALQHLKSYRRLTQKRPS